MHVIPPKSPTPTREIITVMLHMPHIQKMMQGYVNISLKYPPLAISRVELTTLYPRPAER